MSSIYIEDHIPVVFYEGLNTTKDITTTGSLTHSGASTLSGTNTLSGATTISGATVLSGATTSITGAVAFTGAIEGLRLDVVSTTGDVILTSAHSGSIYIGTKTTTGQKFTLPAASTGIAGVFYTIMCGHADGEILIDQAGNEVIKITTFAAVGADADTAIVTTAGGTGIKNSAGSNAIGDSVTLFCDGTGWYSLGITTGVWASQ